MVLIARKKLSWAAILGFACNQGFVFSLFYTGSNRAFGQGDLLFERADLLGTLLFMVVAFAMLRIASDKARGAMLAQSLVWCYAGLLVVGSMIPFLSSDKNIAGLVLESALVGLPSGFMLAAWGQALGRRPQALALSEVFLGSACGAVVCFVILALPLTLAPLALKFLPLGSALALSVLLRLSQVYQNGVSGQATRGDVSVALSQDMPSTSFQVVDIEENQRHAHTLSLLSLRALLFSPREREEAARLSLKMVAGTLLFGLAVGFMETYGSDPGMASTPTLPATLLLFVVFCIAALQLLATGQPEGLKYSKKPGTSASIDVVSESAVEPEGPLDSVYRLAILVMMAGFLFVPVLGDFGVPGEAIVLAGYLGLSAVLVSLFLVMARITGQDAALSFSRGFIALFAGEALGIGLGNVIDVFAGSGQTPYVVVACAGLAALYAYLFLFTERDFRALSVIEQNADRFDDACQLITTRCGLSKREAEILPFALKGRTGERIAAEFFISKSTVDTHLRRIYAKCEVHGRQELIDFGEETLRHLAR